jgi:hypothetical protein
MSVNVSRAVSLSLALVSLAILGGCTDFLGVHGRGNVSLSLSTGRRAASAVAASASVAPITSNGHTLELQSVAVTLSRFELEKVESDVENEHEDEGDDEGEVLISTPTTIDLALNGGAQVAVTVPVPAGTYEQFEGKVESVRLRGTFDGHAFDVTVPVSTSFESEFHPPVVVHDGGTLNVTVKLDPSTWFQNNDGSLIDPSRLGTDATLRALVAARVKASLRAFEDDDRDGEDD